MWDRWERLSTRGKVGAGVVVVVCAPFLIAGMVAGAKDSGGDHKAAAGPASASSGPRPAGGTSPAAGPEPMFTYPGGPQCVITYRDRGDGSMSWTAVTTVAGQLITHATDSTGTVYRHTPRVPAGRTTLTAPVPLAKITDLGGNLDAAGGKSYGCSVGPAS